MVPTAAICFKRRGPNMRNGNTSSTKKTDAVDTFWNHSGACIMYQAIGVGRGCVS